MARLKLIQGFILFDPKARLKYIRLKGICLKLRSNIYLKQMLTNRISIYQLWLIVACGHKVDFLARTSECSAFTFSQL